MVAQDVAEAMRDRLLKALAEQARKVAKQESYYEGEQMLPEPPKSLSFEVYREARDAYLKLAEEGVTNFVALVADAPADRMEVIGFRFSGDGESETRDTAAGDAWRRAHLQADQGLVYTTALSTGKAYALVWGDGERSTITVEHPSQMIVAYRAGTRREREAALKSWTDETGGRRYAVLYLPDGIYKWQAEMKVDPVSSAMAADVAWERWQPEGDQAWPVANEMAVVPVVEFRANPPLKPSPYGMARSEFSKVMPIQDRINKTVFDRLVTAEFQAFRQRYVIGWQPPEDADGNPDARAAYKASVARLQMFYNEDGDQEAIRVGEYAQADFTGFLKAVEADVQQMAAITKTPAYYLLGQMVNISSDAVIAAEAGLIGKVLRHQSNFGESWQEVMKLALRAEGDAGAADATVEILWDDPEQRSWGETVDAALKMQTVGVPTEAVWEMLPGSTPSRIARWRAMRETEALLAPAPAAEAEAPASASE